MTHADAHFAIGKTHKVCEDYAIAGDLDGRAFAIVCDGCSGSHNTDFGSRLLARAAAKNLEVFGDGFNPEQAAWQAAGWVDAIGLHPTALDATLMAVFELDNKQVRIVVIGDGVVAARRRDTGLYDYWAIRYPSGAPGYLTYLLDPGRKQVFLDQTGGKRTVETSWGNTPQTTTDETNWETSSPIWTLDRDPAVYDLVAVMSDGAESFQRPKGTRLEGIPLREVLDQVMVAKGVGAFVTRWVNKFLTRFNPKNLWQHYDDFSMAAIQLDYPED